MGSLHWSGDASVWGNGMWGGTPLGDPIKGGVIHIGVPWGGEWGLNVWGSGVWGGTPLGDPIRFGVLHMEVPLGGEWGPNVWGNGIWGGVGPHWDPIGGEWGSMCGVMGCGVGPHWVTP